MPLGQATIGCSWASAVRAINRQKPSVRPPTARGPPLAGRNQRAERDVRSFLAVHRTVTIPPVVGVEYVHAMPNLQQHHEPEAARTSAFEGRVNNRSHEELGVNLC